MLAPPSDQNLSMSPRQSLSGRKPSYNAFENEYVKLCAKLDQSGAKITDEEQRKLLMFNNLDKEDYLRREKLF